MPTCFAVRFIVPSVRIRWIFNAVNLCEIPKVFSSHLVCFSFFFWAVSSLSLSLLIRSAVCQVTSRASCGWRVAQTEGHSFSQTHFTRLSKTQAPAAREDLKPARGAPCTSSPGESTLHVLHFYCLIDECAFKYMNKKCKPFVWKYFELSIYVCI